MSVPSGLKLALSEDEVNVVFFDTERDRDINVGTCRALPHDFLGWPLGRG